MTKLLIKVDFKEEMKRVSKEVEKMADAEIAVKMDYATKTLRQVTPVDTGRARSGWFFIKLPRIFGKILNTEGFIVNNVPYIDKLNDGHSKQAPRYFIEQVLQRIGILTPM
jgi:hypothetical protein